MQQGAVAVAELFRLFNKRPFLMKRLVKSAFTGRLQAQFGC